MPAEWAFAAKLQRNRALLRRGFPAEFVSSFGDEPIILGENYGRIDTGGSNRLP